MRNTALHPNILMILADDLGYCDLGCYGNGLARTPNIDALAASGIRLEHHYSASPMCAPARAGLLTGKHPHRTGAIDVPCVRGLNRVNPSENTLPRVLKACGYRTGLFGKWHNGGGRRQFHPNAYGYDTFCGFQGGVSPYFDYELERGYGETEHVTTKYITDRLTDEAMAFIDDCGDAPFHLQLAYNAPHRPLEAPEEDIAPFRDCSELTEGLKILYGMVARMDKNIGRLLAHLKARGLEKNTVVLFLSDNGPDHVGTGDMAIRNRPAHVFNGYKGDVLEGGVRVPAIISWPGVLPEGAVNAQPSVFMDWMPTLAGLAGADTSTLTGLDGHDIWPALTQGQMIPADYFWHWTRYQIVNRSNMAVYHNGYKLYYPVYGDSLTYHKPDSPYTFIHGTYDILTDPISREIPPKDTKPQLFYLPDDPQERVDLYDRLPDVARALEALLQRWHEQVKAEFLTASRSTLINPPEEGTNA